MPIVDTSKFVLSDRNPIDSFFSAFSNAVKSRYLNQNEKEDLLRKTLSNSLDKVNLQYAPLLKESDLNLNSARIKEILEGNIPNLRAQAAVSNSQVPYYQAQTDLLTNKLKDPLLYSGGSAGNLYKLIQIVKSQQGGGNPYSSIPGISSQDNTQNNVGLKIPFKIPSSFQSNDTVNNTGANEPNNNLGISNDWLTSQIKDGIKFQVLKTLGIQPTTKSLNAKKIAEASNDMLNKINPDMMDSVARLNQHKIYGISPAFVNSKFFGGLKGFKDRVNYLAWLQIMPEVFAARLRSLGANVSKGALDELKRLSMSDFNAPLLNFFASKDELKMADQIAIDTIKRMSSTLANSYGTSSFSGPKDEEGDLDEEDKNE